MSATHQISARFLNDLCGGILKPVLDVLKLDDTLMLGLRGHYVSIYYRGGELLKLIERQSGGYIPFFNHDYDRRGELQQRLLRHQESQVLKAPVLSTADSAALVDVMWELKRLMDVHPKIASSHEREFQQLIVRENNRTQIASETAYFITDIEYAHAHDERNARFDMLGVRWLTNHRKYGDRLLPMLVEVKYGGGALDGNAGLVKHLEDVSLRMADEAFRQALRQEIGGQFNQLHALGLLKFNCGKAVEAITVSEGKPQVVIVLAGYNPRSGKLREILAELERFDSADAKFELLFFNATFAGYAMHDCAMLSLTNFRALVDSLGARG